MLELLMKVIIGSNQFIKFSRILQRAIGIPEFQQRFIKRHENDLSTYNINVDAGRLQNL